MRYFWTMAPVLGPSENCTYAIGRCHPNQWAIPPKTPTDHPLPWTEADRETLEDFTVDTNILSIAERLMPGPRSHETYEGVVFRLDGPGRTNPIFTLQYHRGKGK